MGYYPTSDKSSNKTATLDSFVRSKPTSQLSYYYLSLIEKDKDNNIHYGVYNVISDYLPEIKKRAKIITLSDEEYYTYRYRPKLLAHYLYGNGELYFIILLLNDIWSVKDFNMKQIKLLSKTDLSELLSNINSSEKEFIDSYNESANS
jgi:hypothetical protein